MRCGRTFRKEQQPGRTLNILSHGVQSFVEAQPAWYIWMGDTYADTATPAIHSHSDDDAKSRVLAIAPHQFYICFKEYMRCLLAFGKEFVFKCERDEDVGVVGRHTAANE